MSAVKKYLKGFAKSIIDGKIVIYKKPKNWGGDILLTFDDGPDPEKTPLILDMLQEAGARAIFFIIGSRACHQEKLLREIVARGHIIGNHTYSHLNDFRAASYTTKCVQEDIDQCSILVKNATEQTTSYFRPPRGEINFKTLTAAKRTGHKVIHWSIEGGEWGRRSDWSAERIGDFLIKNLRSGDIVLLHDDNIKTLSVLKQLLTESKRRGYNLAPSPP